MRSMACTGSLHKATFLLIALLVSALSARAQYDELDRVSERLAHRLANKDTLMVAVPDFAIPEPGLKQSGLGHAFAAFVSQALQHGDSKLPILDHDTFEKELQREGIDVGQVSAKILSGQRPENVPEDILVVGSITKSRQQYRIELSAIRVRDLNKLVSEAVGFGTNEFLESLDAPFPPRDSPALRAAQNGAGSPSCIYCPEPSYSETGRKYRVQGTVVLNVVVGADGRVLATQPVRMLGADLDQQAVKAIKSWKFKPATDAQGQPVNVLIPVEVTFQFF